jgi:cytochrome c5
MRPLFLLAVPLLLAIATFAPARAQDVERGERLVNANCLGCHDLRPIQVQALDMEGWKKALDAEIARGAKVPADDVPVLLEYLVANHGPLPAGAGRAILLNTCTLCHDLKRVRLHQATAEEWAGTLQAMLNEGAPLSDEDFPILLRYLAANFRP